MVLGIINLSGFLCRITGYINIPHPVVIIALCSSPVFFQDPRCHIDFKTHSQVRFCALAPAFNTGKPEPFVIKFQYLDRFSFKRPSVGICLCIEIDVTEGKFDIP